MRFILFFSFVFFTEIIFAQVKLNESFEGTTFPPSGWTKKGGNTQNGENWSRGLSSMYVPLSHSGQAGAMSESFMYPNPVSPNNWLITPSVIVQQGDSLELFVKPSSNVYAAEHFEIRISTSGSDTAAFTSNIYSHTFTTAEAAGFNRLAFSLSQFSGQNIYVAFIHNKCNGQDMLFLDDVKIWNSTNAGITQDNIENAFSFNNNLLIIKNLEQVKGLIIYDIAGKTILNNSTIELKNTYNLSHLTKGIYILNLFTKNYTYVTSKICIN